MNLTKTVDRKRLIGIKDKALYKVAHKGDIPRLTT